MFGHCQFCKGATAAGCQHCNPNQGWIKLPSGTDWEFTTWPREGWKCPICGRGNAPTLLTCPCFRENNKNGR